MNVPAQTVQFEITDLQPTFLDYIQSQKDENTRTFNIQFLFEGDVLSLSGCTATATVTINNIMIEQELACAVDETNNYVTVVVHAPHSGVMAVQVTLTDGTNTLAMPRPLFVRVARDIAETAQIDDNTHGSFAEVVREVADARGNYATLAQAINAKMDADDATVYHVDRTTTNVTYNADNPKIIYVKAIINGQEAVVFTANGNYYQFALCKNGAFLIRELTGGGSTTYKPWTPAFAGSISAANSNNINIAPSVAAVVSYVANAVSVKENTANKATAINGDNIASTVLFPTIGAVVNYLVANYIGNGSGTVKTANIDNGAVTLPKLDTGVIDSTLAVQGAAAEAKSTGNGIGIAKNSINGVSVPMTFPGRINPSGSYSEYANYISSDFIPINENSVFALSDWYTGESNNAYSFYDINKSFISGANYVQGNVLINTIPQNAAFVRFCSANEAWRNISPVATVSDVFVLNEVRNVQKSAGDNYKSIVPLFANFTDGSYINGNGNAQTNADYTATDFIPVDSKTKIALIDFHAGSSSLAYAFYKSDYSFISGQNSVSGDLFVDTIPNSAKYVRLSSKLTRNGENTKHIAVINNYHVQQIVEPLNTNFFEGYNLFKTRKVDVYNNMICDSTGIRVSTNTWSMILPVEPNTDYYFYIPARNRQTAVTTVDYPAAGGNYTFFEPIWVTTYNGTRVYKVTTTATAKYLMSYFYNGEYDLATNKENIIITKKAWNSSPSPSVKTDFLKRHYGSFSILGDSYSTFGGYLTPTSAGTWFPSTRDNNVTEIEQTWWYQFAQMYGSTLKENVSWTGSTISYDGYGTGTDDGKSISFITRMENLTNPELILIYGGTNDSWVAQQSGRADFLGDYKYSGFTESDFVYFRPSVAYVISELKKKHVGAHIIFMLNANLTNIRESVQVICEHYNIPLCELVNIDLTNSHPNQTGMAQIAKYITDFLNAGN